MYVVSCRREFDSPQFFAKSNQLRNYSNPQNPKTFTEPPWEQLIAAAEDKHVLVLVHGFRNPINNVLKSYWELVGGLDDNGLAGAGGYGLVVGFAWPGFQTAPGFFPAVPNANRAAGYLRQLVMQLASPAHTVDVQTHSLGARVALQAMTAGDEVYLDNLMLTAAAVDADCLLPNREFHAALDNCGRCFVYHTNHDNTLKFAFRIGDIFTGFDKALGLEGPSDKQKTLDKCPNVYVIDCAGPVKSHGGYRKAKKYYLHWKNVLSNQALPRYDEI